MQAFIDRFVVACLLSQFAEALHFGFNGLYVLVSFVYFVLGIGLFVVIALDVRLKFLDVFLVFGNLLA